MLNLFLPRSGQWYLAWLFHLQESQRSCQYPEALCVVCPLEALGIKKKRKSMLFSFNMTMRNVKCYPVTFAIIIYVAN